MDAGLLSLSQFLPVIWTKKARIKLIYSVKYLLLSCKGAASFSDQRDERLIALFSDRYLFCTSNNERCDFDMELFCNRNNDTLKVCSFPN